LNEDAVYGGRIGYFLTEQLSFEGSVLTGETEIEGTTSKADLIIPMGEAQYHFGKGVLRPFVALGAGSLMIDRESGTNKNNFISSLALD